jgi:hypothetical protein
MPQTNPPPRARKGKSVVRRFARYRTELPITVRVLGHEGYLRVHGRCFEITESGLGAVITSELTPGEMTTLEFCLPEQSDPLVLRAVVRHRIGFLHGFEFVGIGPTEQERIRNFCRTLAPG